MAFNIKPLECLVAKLPDRKRSSEATKIKLQWDMELYKYKYGKAQKNEILNESNMGSPHLTGVIGTITPLVRNTVIKHNVT